MKHIIIGLMVSMAFSVHAMHEDGFEIVQDDDLITRCKAEEANLITLMTKINTRLEGDITRYFDNKTDLHANDISALSCHAKNVLSTTQFIYNIDLQSIHFIYKMHEGIVSKIQTHTPAIQQQLYPPLIALLEQKFNGLFIHTEEEKAKELITLLLSDTPISYVHFHGLLLTHIKQ